MDKYPIKEVAISKTYMAYVFIRAESDKEALEKARTLCESGKFDDQFTDEAIYDVEKWNAYKEDVINEDFIY